MEFCPISCDKDTLSADYNLKVTKHWNENEIGVLSFAVMLVFRYGR
jgi:hypothetical protein